MRKIKEGFRLTAFILLSFMGADKIIAQDNTLVEISGQVTDQEKKEPIANVSVQIKSTVNGTVTNSSGQFVLRTKIKPPFTIIFSSVGFAPQELEVKSFGSNLQVALATQAVLGNDVVVTASRVPEKFSVSCCY
jgi:hypothetical protein